MYDLYLTNEDKIKVGSINTNASTGLVKKVKIKNNVNHLVLDLFENNLSSIKKYNVPSKKGKNAISENNGIVSPPKKMLKDKQTINEVIIDWILFKYVDAILKVNTAASVLKKTCVKRIETSKFPDDTIKKGTKKTWKMIGRQPLSLKIDNKKPIKSLFS